VLTWSYGSPLKSPELTYQRYGHSPGWEAVTAEKTADLPGNSLEIPGCSLWRGDLRAKFAFLLT
jgi:hypothetical protein